MTVRRVMGIETEYGISVPGQPGANAMVTSSQVVNAYLAASAARARRARWDFEEENPLRDARGFDLAREVADSSQLTDEDLGLANVILTNGARLYVDHAHPEYSTPECTNPWAAVIWDKAGERVMHDAAVRASGMPGNAPIQLYKNNTDTKGASYGCHENYLMRRATPFADIVRHLTPFFVSRQVFAGAGKVGIGQDSRGDGYQISQRADFFEVEVGLETTLKRPIINTRDEPHADPEKYRRLHVIIGDANMSEISTYLQGRHHLAGPGDDRRRLPHRSTSRSSRRSPSSSAISHDPSLEAHRDAAVGAEDDGDPAPDGVPGAGPQIRRGPLRLQRRRDDQRRAQPVGVGADPARRRPDAALRELDWVAKLELLEGYRTRDKLPWSHPVFSSSTSSTPTSGPSRGLYNRLVERGRMQRLVTEDDVERAVETPPTDTRAYFRGRCLRQYSESGRRGARGTR